MNRRERRELRAIERTLDADEPALALLLAAEDEPTTRVKRFAWASLWVALAVLGSGLLLGDTALVVAGCLVLVVFPCVVMVMAAAARPR